MNCTKLQENLVRLKNLSQDTAKRLPSLMLSIGMMACLLPASAQFSPIKKEGEIYYEYIDPVVSTYDHYLTLPNGEGHSFYKFKTLEAAQQNIRTAQERAIAQIKARLDPTGLATCAFGPITVNDAPAVNNY